MESGYFAYDDGTLYYETHGTGTPLVCIHGFTLDHRMWRPQVEYFAPKFRVVTYDLRGYGKSSIPTGEYSHLRDLDALLTHLNVDTHHLVGLSLGGEFATNYTLTYPKRVLSLTLADSSLGGYRSTVDWRVYAKEHGISGAKNNWLNHELFKATTKRPAAFEVVKRIVAEYSGWHWLNVGQGEEIHPPAIERLRDIEAPTQIVVGNEDLSYFIDVAHILNEGIPQSKLHVIDDAGHMVNLEQPEKFNSLLERFIH